MHISRRTILSGAATVMAAAPAIVASAGSFTPAEAATADYGALPSKEKIWEDMLFLTSLGSRNTGFPGHVKFVNFLADRLRACPSMQVFRDTYTFPRWEATNYALSAKGGDGETVNLHATSPFPYSGKTTAKGVTGKLVDLGITTPNEVGGSNPVNLPGDVKGKILLLQSPVHGFPFGDNYHPWGSYLPGLTQPDRIKEAIWQNRSAPNIDQFAKAGAAGVILSWTDVSDENAEGQYAPFGHKFADCPTLWVGKKTGDRLKTMAAAGAEATVILEANVYPNTATDTVYGLLPGASDEIVLVHTHSDGPNACEENGGIGVVALAKYISSLPKGTLKRTYLFTMTTGHMVGAYVHSFRDLQDKHPDLMKRIVGGLVFEHLGSMMYVDRGDAWVPEGGNQPILLQTQSKTLADLMLKSAAGSIDDRIVAVNPYQHRYTGECSGPIEYGIPTIGYMPAPSYLLKESVNCGIERMDARLYRAQLENFTRVLRSMDGMTKEQFAGTAPLAG
jgi:hypothetical protein